MCWTTLSQTSHCSLCRRTYFAFLCALGILEIDSTGESYFSGKAKNSDALWDSPCASHWQRALVLSSEQARKQMACQTVTVLLLYSRSSTSCAGPVTTGPPGDLLECRSWAESPLGGQSLQAGCATTAPSPHLRTTSAAEVDGTFHFPTTPSVRQSTSCCLCCFTFKYLQAVLFFSCLEDGL